VIKVAVAGNFYPLHEGHIDHMEKAKKLGDYLIAIIGNDDHLRRKGKPILPVESRARIVGAIRYVDKVVVAVDRDGTCAETLRLVKPDIFAKGGETTFENMPPNEIKVCDEIGCRIIYGVGDLLNSSSAILKKMVESGN